MAEEPGARRRTAIGLYAILSVEFFSNHKVRKAGRMTALGPFVYAFALTRNAKHGRTGSFPATELEPWFLADQLQIGEPEAAAALEACVGVELLAVDGKLAIVCGWDEAWARRSLTESEARVLRRNREPEIQIQKETKKENPRARERRESKNKRNPDTSGQSPDSVRTPSLPPSPARALRVVSLPEAPEGKNNDAPLSSGASGRTQTEIDLLVSTTWAYAAQAHGRLIASYDHTARPWTVEPSGAPARDLEDRVIEVLESYPSGEVEEVLFNAVNVAAARARHLGSLKYFTPSGLFGERDFWFAAQQSPEQASGKTGW